jgi:hypothetical protein
MSTTASAYYVDGSEVKDSSGNGNQGKYTYTGYYFNPVPIFGTYDGYIGNVDIGNPSGGGANRIGTAYLVRNALALTSTDGYASNNEDSFPNASNVHWYRFSSNTTSILDVYYEWDQGVDDFKLELFEYDGSDTAMATAIFDSSSLFDSGGNHIGHYDDLGFTNIAAGDYLVRITGSANSSLDGYSVYFDTTAVPLPPAALLFISALAGFGVIGRRRASKVVS